jgi:hypothetical protein
MARALILGCVSFALAAPSAPIAASAFVDAQSKWTVKFGVQDPTAVAWGVYTDMAGTDSGFGQLSVSTSSSFPDATQMYGAGYLEAALTQPRIWSHANNTLAWISSQFKGGVIPQVVINFFTTQDQWKRAQIASNTSEYWTGVKAIVSQLDGLVAGYTALAPENETLSAFDIWSVGAIGDYLDLITALTDDGPDYENMTDAELMAAVRKNNHCSALVKVTGDFSELFFAHVAWFIYQSTTRIFKHYNFALNQASVAGHQMSFSSYPAYLSSLDDWYAVWSSGIAVLETTNNVFNKSLYAAVVPQSLFAWERVRLANLLAHSAPEWADIFAQHNSGTYNNQYPVINVGKFVPGQALPSDLLWIVEQVPGLVVSGDATELLALGHFPSYNVPFWREIYDISGYKEQLERRVAANNGTLGELSGLDWQLAPRAKIFRRDAGKVVDMDSFLELMRSNAYKTDPYAAGSPWNAICSRGDLAGSPDGCLVRRALWRSTAAHYLP